MLYCGMKFFVALVLSFIVSLNVFAQDVANLKQQATQLVTATIHGDYKTLVDHTYPSVVDASGGKDKMVQSIKGGLDDMQKHGATFDGASVGKPGKFYHTETETFSLVPDVTTLHYNQGKIVNNGYLLAISKDKGKFWYFIDVNAFTYGSMKKFVPHLPKGLVVPKPAAPSFVPDKK